METGKLIVLSKISDEEKELAKNQLKIILASTYFNSAKQMQRFLEYVVEKTLDGEGNLLKQYTIGVEALDFPDSFDSDSNPVIRIMGGRVRSRLEEFYKDTDNNKIVISIPKGTYAPEFSYPNSNNPKSLSNHEIYTSTGPILSLVSFTDETQNEMSNRLLLQTGDALAEQLSCFVSFSLLVYNPFADKTKSHSIGKSIDSDYVLALFVQELADEKFELICRLVNKGPEEVIWSESYDLDAKKPISGQHNVLGKITAAMADMHQGILHPHWARDLLLNKESIPDEFKVIAYYRQYYDDFTIAAFAEAVLACETALQRNTNDINANILFSDLCYKDYVHAYDLIDSSLLRGIECAKRVTHLRQDSNVARYTLGQLLYCQGEWDRSLEQFNLARSGTHTHGIIDFGCGHHLCLMGHWDVGISLVHKAIKLSKAYPSWYHIPLFLSFYNQGKYQEALLEAEKIVTPSMIHGSLARCISNAQLGNMLKAKDELIEVIKRFPGIEKDCEASIFRLIGNEELAKKICNGLDIVIKG